MPIFKRKQAETRDLSTPENACDIGLLRALGFSGDTVTFEQALQIPAVSAAIDFIAGICARVPVKLYREHDGKSEEITQDKRVRLLNDDTGDLLNPYQMKKAWVTDYFDGRGYVYINKEGADFKSLNYVEKVHVSVVKTVDPIYKDADILITDRKYYPFQFLRLCRDTKDGVTGKSITETNGELLSLYYDTIRFERLLMNTGGNKKGFLKSEKKMSEQAMEEIRRAWRELFNRNGNNMMILNSGMDFKETSSTSTELQLNENKITNANDITMIFLLNAHALQGANDDEIVSAVKTAVMPIIEQMEIAYNQGLLLEAEKSDMYFACDTSRLERGDILKRYQAYKIALEQNFMQPDEVRYAEDLSPLGLDWIKLGLDSVLYNPKTHEIYTPNTNETAKMNKLETSSEMRSGGNHNVDYIKGEKGLFQGSRSSGGGSSAGGGSGVDKSGESGIIDTNGLGANDSDNRFVEEHDPPQFIKTINPNDEKAVRAELESFEKSAVDKPIETACVITAKGEVYHCFGVADRVYVDSDLGDKLKGASVTHNHTIEETTFSFSNDDICLFENYDLKILRGCDEKFVYELNHNSKDIDDEVMDWQNEENFRHSAVRNDVFERGYGYRRKAL